MGRSTPIVPVQADSRPTKPQVDRRQHCCVWSIQAIGIIASQDLY
jgi:hypothetical protein